MARPFLKWAGGKGQLLDVITANLPAHFTRYVEPFVGSGAVMFKIQEDCPEIKHFIINDINEDLINLYASIRDNKCQMVKILQQLQADYISADEVGRNEMYYRIRDLFNERLVDKVEQSCYFIFLNRTCFNGLYRVNSKNLFNVPSGKYKNPKICDEENLARVAEVLSNVEIRNNDYSLLIDCITPNTFVYLDPPYKPISDTSTFNSYSFEKFDDGEQIRLKQFCDQISAAGAYFMLSNSDPTGVDKDARFFDELYQAYHIRRVLARRNINANGSNRGAINELLITNY